MAEAIRDDGFRAQSFLVAVALVCLSGAALAIPGWFRWPAFVLLLLGSAGAVWQFSKRRVEIGPTQLQMYANGFARRPKLLAREDVLEVIWRAGCAQIGLVAGRRVLTPLSSERAARQLATALGVEYVRDTGFIPRGLGSRYPRRGAKR
jgi:hypothetical protein